MLYKAIDGTKDILVKRLPRGSLPWRAAYTVLQWWYYLHARNPLNRRRWAANTRQFEEAIAARERETSEFCFIQVGACDGKLEDPIFRHVKEHRWRGVLIEPQKAEFERLKVNYAAEAERLVFVNAAISDREGERQLHKVKEGHMDVEWQRGIASFLPVKGVHDPTLVTTETVACITFDKLRQQHSLERIDLLQVDTEGYDYEILKLANLERFKPKLIRYEHKHLSLSDLAECQRYLRRNGYEVLPMQTDTGAILH